ncbi:hypothetical protein [Streptosporangium sp. NPDC051022]|uniref:hypothetical protein n=1 Tax=Streptosporangium sp. NPDC051022 TaxID=3155752 RepID=UPI00342F71CC
MNSSTTKAAARIQELAAQLAEELEEQDKKPDRFATACLVLATRTAEAQTRSYAEAGQWMAALVEVLTWDLLYASPGGPPGGMAEAGRRARQEAERLVRWSRENPDELDVGYDSSFVVWTV